MKYTYSWLVAALMITHAYSAWCADSNLQHQSGFGLTHFILYPSPLTPTLTLPSKKQSTLNPSLSQFGWVINVLFAPDDDLALELITMIDKEQHKIAVAIFLITDERITQALINAHRRNVQIEIVVDPKHMYDRFSRVEQLCKAGISVFMFNPKYTDSRGTGLMHNKFVIFGDQSDPATLIWSGSFNFTRAAGQYNQEHVVIFQGPAVVKRFAEQFQLLKGRCTRYQPGIRMPADA